MMSNFEFTDARLPVNSIVANFARCAGFTNNITFITDFIERFMAYSKLCKVNNVFPVLSSFLIICISVTALFNMQP
jgi:hypothetical protein